MNRRKILIIVAVLAIIGLAYYFLVYKNSASSTSSTTGTMSAADANMYLVNAAKGEPNPAVSNEMLTYISGLSDYNKQALASIYQAIVNGTANLLTPAQTAFYNNVIAAGAGFHW